jgi:uncharacterized protein
MLTYVGKGYGAAFVENYDAVVRRLSGGEELLLVEGPDDICRPLLEDADAHCFRDSVLERDARAASAVGELLGRPLRAGERFSLDPVIVERMREAFRGGTTRSACVGCEWFDLCTAIARDDFADVKLGAE